MTVPARLRTPALSPLWTAAHHRLSSGRLVARIRVGPLDSSQQEALADLLGLDRLPGVHTAISLTTLDQVLQEAAGQDTRAVVTALIGPLEDRAAQRARSAAERAALWRWLTEHEVVTGQPALRDWTRQVQQGGVIGGSVAATREVLEAVLTTLRRLPAEGTPLPAFADAVLDDPHALDDGTRVANLVLRALATLHNSDPPSGAEERRALWERAGVAADELSTTVLAAGLRTNGDGLASQILQQCADAGHAAALTLAQLRALGERLGPVPGDVWVVENPTLLALALQRFGSSCPPLVCTSGWPNSAGVLLLRRLADAGSSLHYHGDLDGEGLRIAAYVIAKTGASPWRMSTPDYLTALPENASGPPAGRITDAPWDPELAPAMSAHQVSVPEERVANILLADLASTIM